MTFPSKEKNNEHGRNTSPEMSYMFLDNNLKIILANELTYFPVIFQKTRQKTQRKVSQILHT